MIKAVFWILVGAAGALESERWMDKVRARFSPRAVTDGLFNSVNERLEKDRARQPL